MIRLRHKLFVSAMRGVDPAILIVAVLVVLEAGQPHSTTQALGEYLWKASRPGDNYVYCPRSLATLARHTGQRGSRGFAEVVRVSYGVVRWCAP